MLGKQIQIYTLKKIVAHKKEYGTMTTLEKGNNLSYEKLIRERYIIFFKQNMLQ